MCAGGQTTAVQQWNGPRNAQPTASIAQPAYLQSLKGGEIPAGSLQPLRQHAIPGCR
jgi:hypothetical protein